ncbi:MAG: hypothetical protein A4E73_03671 [Syntrophaceae bacterium PtaU1.Bin231]|nr:MAG: hypothetical protein A4E73_03671 [Syntrophaceae bacterium PtaU1.Bin231]
MLNRTVMGTPDTDETESLMTSMKCSVSQSRKKRFGTESSTPDGSSELILTGLIQVSKFCFVTFSLMISMLFFQKDSTAPLPYKQKINNC